MGGRAVVRERLFNGLGFGIALILVGALSSRLAPPFATALAAPQLPGTGLDQLAVAADALAAAMATGGTGLTFEVVQHDSVHAKPGGPLIGVRDSADPAKVVAEVDEVAVNTVITRGAVTADAFWMEMRLSPGSEPNPGFDGSAFFARVLERDGVIWRDDGDGWYETDVSPGSGMDPVSARLLPKLLRSAVDPAVLQPEFRDGRLLPGVRGDAGIDDYPGVLAADGRDFTSPTFEVTYWLDETGRLVRLETSALNLNAEVYDLLSETVVTFGYGSTGDPPEPSPTMGPDPTPEPEPESVEVGS
jgi:hypothetical protein